MDHRDFGRTADVSLSVLIDDLLGGYLEFSSNVENISAIEENSVLMRTALAAFLALKVELGVQVHQLPLNFFCAAFCR